MHHIIPVVKPSVKPDSIGGKRSKRISAMKVMNTNEVGMSPPQITKSSAQSRYDRFMEYCGHDNNVDVRFYQFFQDVLTFVRDDDEFLKLTTMAARRNMLRSILQSGIRIRYKNESKYRDFIANIFTEHINCATGCRLVFRLMNLVQSSDYNITGDQKHAFTVNGTRAIMKFLDISESDQNLINSNVDAIIATMIHSRDSLQKLPTTTVAKKKKKMW